MQKKSLITLTLLFLVTLTSCSQSPTPDEKIEEVDQTVKVNTKQQVQHRYGGYYCPDNLGGFPAVDIEHWESVPVVNGRMATQEETQNGTSLINVDMEKYPNAKPLDIEMPKLARYYNRSSKKEEIIIVIQAINVSNDSVLGFRFLNGGNGSAYLNEVKFLSDNEIEEIPTSRFVRLNLNINATQNEVWKVLTNQEYSKTLQAIFDKENKLESDWYKSSKINFKYLNAGVITNEYAGELYGNMYIQIDSELEEYQYVEKFFVGEDQETKTSDFVIVCGPYGDDYEIQKNILNKWTQKVKELSEK